MTPHSFSNAYVDDVKKSDKEEPSLQHYWGENDDKEDLGVSPVECLGRKMASNGQTASGDKAGILLIYVDQEYDQTNNQEAWCLYWAPLHAPHWEVAT